MVAGGARKPANESLAWGHGKFSPKTLIYKDFMLMEIKISCESELNTKIFVIQNQKITRDV